jgi:hypothetical protein
VISTLEVAGDGYARGLAIGRTVGPRIRAHMSAWLASLPGDGEAHARALLAHTDFRPAIAAHAPDLLAETQGMAEGAALDPDLVFALQLMDEEWAWRRKRATKCSSLAVTAARRTLIGQNMDLPPYTDGYQQMLRIEGDGETPGALIFTTAGVIALMGVNAAGVAVCVNSLPQLPSRPEGLPVAFVIRLLLRCRSLAEAAQEVASLPHATNQHYLIGEPGQARSFEACAAWVSEYRPADPARIFHTNHPLAEPAGEAETEKERENSVARLAALERRLASGAVDLAQAQAALASCDDPKNPVSRVYDPAAGLIGFTTGSLISVLERGAGVRAFASAGPPSVRGYNEFVLGEPALA